MHRWAPLFRIAVASAADLVADWFFYAEINASTDPALEKYKLYLFIFFIVSASMVGLTYLVLLAEGFSSSPAIRKAKHWILHGEMLLGDAPQFVLTGLIIADKGELTLEAALNIVTSAYNFVFDILESCGDFPPEEEIVDKDPADPELTDPEVGLAPAVIDE